MKLKITATFLILVLNYLASIIPWKVCVAMITNKRNAFSRWFKVLFLFFRPIINKFRIFWSVDQHAIELRYTFKDLIYMIGSKASFDVTAAFIPFPISWCFAYLQSLAGTLNNSSTIHPSISLRVFLLLWFSREPVHTQARSHANSKRKLVDNRESRLMFVCTHSSQVINLVIKNLSISLIYFTPGKPEWLE